VKSEFSIWVCNLYRKLQYSLPRTPHLVIAYAGVTDLGPIFNSHSLRTHSCPTPNRSTQSQSRLLHHHNWHVFSAFCPFFFGWLVMLTPGRTLTCWRACRPSYCPVAFQRQGFLFFWFSRRCPASNARPYAVRLAAFAVGSRRRTSKEEVVAVLFGREVAHGVRRSFRGSPFPSHSPPCSVDV
jgi:hypothetical protein